MKKIMFNDTHALTRLVIEGTKTQTRRPYIINHRPAYDVLETVAIAQRYSDIAHDTSVDTIARQNAYLKLRESGWNNKMFVKANLMPHRIIILDRWVEHLQDITPEDCLNEGITRGVLGYVFPNHPFHYENPYDAYEQLIKLLYGKNFWDTNPLVYAYKFKPIR